MLIVPILEASPTPILLHLSRVLQRNSQFIPHHVFFYSFALFFVGVYGALNFIGDDPGPIYRVICTVSTRLTCQTLLHGYPVKLAGRYVVLALPVSGLCFHSQKQEAHHAMESAPQFRLLGIASLC